MNPRKLILSAMAGPLLAAVAAVAQDGGAAARPAQLRQGRAAARAAYAAGRDAAAEQALAPVLRRKAGTAAGRLELAQIQVQLALEAAAQGQAGPAEQLARRALQQVAQCVQQAGAGEADLAANALELAGFVHERFLGDWAEARRSYRLAVQQWPGGDAGKQALDRLDATEREAKLKSGSGHGG